MEWYNWALLEVSENDFILGGDFDINKLPKIEKQIFEYNQLEFKQTYGYCLCTAYARIWVASDNLGTNINMKQRQDLVKLRYNAPDFDPKVWGRLSEGINITRNYLKTIWKDVISYRLSTKSQLFWDLLNKWYSLNIWINVSDDLLKDMQDNWIIEKATFWKTKYWHSIRIKDLIIDNYEWIFKYNKYKVKRFK